jgi:hypothetical protein
VVLSVHGHEYRAVNGILKLPQEFEAIAQQHGFRKLATGELSELAAARAEVERLEALAAEPATQEIGLQDDHPQTEATEQAMTRTLEQGEKRIAAEDAQHDEAVAGAEA